MSRVSIARADLALGMPLPWMVHDQDGNVLMQEGEILETEEQIQKLLAARPLRELTWNAGDAAAANDGDEPIDAATDAALGADASESRFTFQDMRLRVGDRLQLQPPATVSTERYVVKLIGYVENVSVLVTAPMANGLRVPLRENDAIVARIFAGQKAFGFSSTVERVCKIPFDYLHLSFPEKVQGSVIRKSPRVRTRIIASVANTAASDAAERQSGVIVNLSADGALVKARQPLGDKGDRLMLSFRVSLHKVDAYLTVSGVVRSAFADEEKDRGDGATFGHGIQFDDLAPNDTVILQSLIYHQMIEHPHTLT
ncbi:MAG TPA: flagellar brake protein [Rhodocyclaceae bacterium]